MKITKIIDAIYKIININYWLQERNLDNPAFDTELKEKDLVLYQELDIENTKIPSKGEFEKMKDKLGLDL